MPLNIIVYSGMREPLACQSASAKNAVACRGLRVGPSKVRLNLVLIRTKLRRRNGRLFHGDR